jgi:uncharacterized protein (TIGR03083 family)
MTASIHDLIAAERRDLADLLDTFSPEDWDAPSLCEGWRVREVVAHITMAFRYSTGRFLRGMLAARGNFDRMADRSARGDAAGLTASDLVAILRDNLDHRWKPPGQGYDASLSHDVIHGLDITVARDVGRKVPADRLQIVLDGLTPKSVRYFGTDLDGIELVADDLDFRFGSGEPLHGAAQDLLLVICGRKLPQGHLAGPSSARFTRG